MRLLFISHSFPPADRPLSNVGGMQRVATELYEALSHQKGLDLSSMVLRSTWRWTHLRAVPFMAGVLWHLARRAAARDVDVVLFSSMVTAALAIPLRGLFRRAGIRTALIAHGRDVTLPLRLYQFLVPFVFRANDLVLPISHAVRQECIRRGARDAQVRPVPNGIKIDRYAQLRSRVTSRARIAELLSGRHQLPDNALLLCSVGRLVERKGFAWFVENVLPLLPRNVHYLLAGEGPAAASIRAAAERQDVSDRVILLGRVTDEDLASIYRASDLFVMPNVPVPGDMEGFGVVMLEAGLNGLPSVASRLEGIQDVISPGMNGHLLEPMDALGFAERIQSYLENRGELADAAARARMHVRSNFGWDAVAGRYVRTLSSLMPRHRATTMQHSARPRSSPTFEPAAVSATA